MTRIVCWLRVVLLGVALSSTVAGCNALQEGTIGDDTGPTLQDTLSEFRCNLYDGGVGNQENLRYCAVAPFYENCPLRVCVEQLGAFLNTACPPEDSGMPPVDQQFCDAIADLREAATSDNVVPAP